MCRNGFLRTIAAPNFLEILCKGTEGNFFKLHYENDPFEGVIDLVPETSKIGDTITSMCYLV